MQVEFAIIVKSVLTTGLSICIAKAVINVVIVLVWDIVTSVNSVGIVQPCVPMKTVHFVKLVLGRFVLNADNVRYVHMVYSVRIADLAVNVVDLCVRIALFAMIVSQYVNANNAARIVLHCVGNVRDVKTV